MSNQKVTIYIDGGSRGNPGDAACAFVFPELNKEYAEYLGKATNNEAEYSGLIFALKKAKALLGKDKIKQVTLEIKSDSELLVKQMQGKYKIKEPHIQQLFLTAWNLKTEFKEIIFVYIPREQNTKADHLLNETLDNHGKKQSLF
ncbi:ribonuclease HI family protein [Candidatus Parcubacteria bacterium]|nr:ribonuclease HI family protein [Candidatus Parcubacteria bacterium]